MHLLRDSTEALASPCRLIEQVILVALRRDPLKFDGLAFRNTELLIKFPCSDENDASGFSEAF